MLRSGSRQFSGRSCLCLLQKQARQMWPDPRMLTTSAAQHKKRILCISREDKFDEELTATLPPVLRYIEDKRIVFSSYINKRYKPMTLQNRRRLLKINIQVQIDRRLDRSIPIVTQDRAIAIIPELETPFFKRNKQIEHLQEIEDSNTNSFPFKHISDVPVITKTEVQSEFNEPDYDYAKLPEINIKREITERLAEYDKGYIEPVSLYASSEDDNGSTVVPYNERAEEEREDSSNQKKQPCGSADASVPVSDVPCGGCGALLHCQDPAIPGFKPKEIFVGQSNSSLKASVCQRCFFLTNHDIALQVRVAPESYLELLRPIRSCVSMILLLVDLTDAPCSIHPGIMSVVASGQPVIVVGTKVDLLPMDSNDCLDRLNFSLRNLVKMSPLHSANIFHTCLVSGYTGFGVEELVSVVHNLWRNRGDVYLVGSTNAGKSTLYNALVNSDLCQKDASDKLLPATTSAWPGTTLNMLKFPMQRMSGKRVQDRLERLANKTLGATQQLRHTEPFTSNLQLATLKDDVERTMSRTPLIDSEVKDLFHQSTAPPRFEPDVVGINANSQRYRDSRWCFDTPGALQPDQCLSLLTHEELLDTLSKSVLVPETFRMRPGRSIFIAGLGRVDVLHLHHTEKKSIGRIPRDHTLLTVFRSSALPISVVNTVSASAYYRDRLGSELLHVPRGSDDRLAQWPALKPTDVTVRGVEGQIAAADLVLSSAGWISVTLTPNTVCKLRMWTPGGRGAFVRRQPFLPYAVKLRGDRFKSAIHYGPHKLYDGRMFRMKYGFGKDVWKALPRIKGGVEAVQSATGNVRQIETKLRIGAS